MPKHRDQPAPRRTSTRALLIAAALVVLTFVIYRPVKGFTFVRYDDQDLVLENEHIREGLTARNVIWALTTAESANWYPLTRFSQMLDIELFGIDAGWHHLTNLVIHALAGALLFFLLRRLTGADWPSAAVTFLFLLHPLHVESVAWIAERKDVLSTLFWFATIWAYVGYVARPSTRRYALIIVAFLCGLMSKPMIVTLPLLLVLLDFWPLKRGWQLRDKIPLFALSAVVSIVTFLAQRSAGAMGLKIVLLTRIGNAAISCIVYLAQFFWPAKLAVFYPYPAALPVWQVAGATVVIIAISIAAWRFRERAPYFAIGWAWYLITLLPVIGIIQVGQQSHADRYTYVPLVGISIAMVWGVSEALAKLPRIKPMVMTLASAAAVGCVMATAAQLDHWKDSEALFRHALAVTERNHVAHLNLGSALWRSGRAAEAADHYRAALALRPDDAGGHGGLGQALVQQGDLEAGVVELSEAIRLAPNFGDARFLLGSVLGRLGRTPEAIEHLTEAVRLRPQDADFHHNLANALATSGRMDEAVVEFRAALERNPSDAMTYYSLGNALGTQGRLDEAITNFEQALRLRPGMQEARQRLEYTRALRAQQTPPR